MKTERISERGRMNEKNVGGGCGDCCFVLMDV
jgi:hypothetical protein